jgi:predicted metal-dependent enzyme (double-stranded beta helix superfamily)
MSTVEQGSALSQFAASLGALIRNSPSTDRLAPAARDLVRASLRDQDFVLDCIDAATSTIEPGSARWANPPIVDDDELDYSVRLVYWPAGAANAPHRHTFWTVTGVLANVLTFTTYADSAGSGDELSGQAEFPGEEGEAGYIVPPCIHQVSNPSPRPSVSLHVFSGPKHAGGEPGREHERGHTEWLAHDASAVKPQLNMADVIDPLAERLGRIGGDRAVDLVQRLLPYGDLRSRLECVKALSRHDRDLAARHLRELAALCRGADRDRLLTLAEAMAATRAE